MTSIHSASLGAYIPPAPSSPDSHAGNHVNTPQGSPSSSTSVDSHDVEIVISSGDAENSPNAVAIRETLSSYFSPHMNGENHQTLQTLIHNRAARLNDMGETPASIDAVLTKGQRLDRLAVAASGTINSVPFGSASRLLDVVPSLTALATTPAQVGLIAGAFSGITDTVGSKALEKATSDILWLTAKDEELEPVMRDAAKASQPSDLRKAAEVGLSYQTFSLRNVLRVGTATVAAKTMSPASAANLDSWIAAVGSPIAGGTANSALHQVNHANHRIGPAYLFGKQNWEAIYTSLKESHPIKDPLINAGKRIANVPVDTILSSGENIKTLLSAKSVVRNVGMLGGGFSGVQHAKSLASEAATKSRLSLAVSSAITQSVNTAATAPVVVAWTSSDMLTQKGLTQMKNVATSVTNKVTDYVRNRSAEAQTPMDLESSFHTAENSSRTDYDERSPSVHSDESFHSAESQSLPDVDSLPDDTHIDIPS